MVLNAWTSDLRLTSTSQTKGSVLNVLNIPHLRGPTRKGGGKNIVSLKPKTVMGLGPKEAEEEEEAALAQRVEDASQRAQSNVWGGLRLEMS